MWEEEEPAEEYQPISGTLVTHIIIRNVVNTNKMKMIIDI